MKLLAVISHKGGAGKTTSSVQIAEELARRGQRTLLVDADRQQGAGLLLGIDAPAGCVQRTTVPQLDYLGSARLTDLEIADCYASVAGRFDIGVVDTPSLDDVLARAWLREAAAVLMVLQVDPLTVKTLPSALNTLEVVRAFKPSIQMLGLLPTMFNTEDEAHGKLLAELLSRRPEAVFTPVVPADPGLMHRANQEDCPPVGEAARQAYQCAVDRILRALECAAPSVSMPRAARFQPDAPAPLPQGAPARPAAPAVASSQRWQEDADATSSARPAAREEWQEPSDSRRATVDGERDRSRAETSRQTIADSRQRTLADFPPALETLASSRVEEPRRKVAAENTNAVPEWWQGQDGRVDAAGVARRRESWLMRSRFAIACTVACLALIAAVVMGTMRRVPTDGGTAASGGQIPAAMAGTRQSASHVQHDDNQSAASASGDKRARKKLASGKRAHGAGGVARTGKHTGSNP